MIKFDKFTLDNGLRVIVHTDKSSPIVAFNILYDVGARDEVSDKTGFAHLFEHLMFGGSENIPSFDSPLQKVGGENNAFTSNDITNYYITLPKTNIETAFWLESDRMNKLDFSDKSLDVQRNVVIEEFRQRYLNQPYGDVWLLLRPLAYKKHSYRWNTIGKEISHIEEATLDDVTDFFYNHYAPNNAILAVAGDVTTEEIKQLSEKWFAPIERRKIKERDIEAEPIQTEARTLSVERDVPVNAIFKVYHTCGRMHPDYHKTDLISDILSNGKSSRFFQRLIQEKEIFTSIDAYIMGSIDPGLFVVAGHINPGFSMKDAENAIDEELSTMMNEEVSEYELNKVINKIESTLVFGEIKNLNKAMRLSYKELLGDANLINKEIEKYREITVGDIKKISNEIFRPDNCSTLYYNSMTSKQKVSK